MKITYFDNAASSWPKPPGVAEAMMECVQDYAANPGRGSHSMAVRASRALFNARKQLAILFGVKNPVDISFAPNATMALNQAIKGYVRPGDHVITTSLEHNSVRRPLEQAKSAQAINLDYITTDQQGYVKLEELKETVRPDTRLVVINHSSNLLGSIQPIGEMSALVKSIAPNAKILVDAAQSAGIIPINVEQMGIDMLAFPGHKGLYGPQGTGGLYLHPELELVPLLHGGTGSQSEAIEQPVVRPDRYEAGTQNTPGIAGLAAGVKFVLQETVEAIHEKEWALTQQMMEGLCSLNGIHILGTGQGVTRTGIVAFTIEGKDSSEVAFWLDRHYNIAVRSGYHCTPLAHESAGTLGRGAVRAGIGYFNTADEVSYFIESIAEICKKH
ncbi:aminotransferase class V-fold PLP-dependent enzyme [Paenibacillus gansuensis]|uniref:cysteine desulfurase n=1 Tax=Paenibacillus gansuensis TaxID=306542 RepID=A0ABW5PIY8_9BACL